MLTRACFLSWSVDFIVLPGVKREFADLDDDEEELYPTKKVDH